MAKNYRSCNRLVGDARDAVHAAYDRGYQQAKTDYKRNNNEWIPTPNEKFISYKCSGCQSLSIAKYSFCPHCGSDMREDET